MSFLSSLVFVVFVAVLLANLTTAQDAQKRSSLLNKRAGNKNIFQKSTTTTTEANDEVRLNFFSEKFRLILQVLKKI